LIGEIARSGPAREADEPPLIAGMMLGVRAWDVDLDHREDCRLLGQGEFPWRTGGLATVAECAIDVGSAGRRHSAEGSGPGGAPDPGCNCGLYALHPWTCRLRGSGRHHGPFHGPTEFRVAGVVQAWGRIELYEDGFRAEKARPIAIVLPMETLDQDQQAAFADLAKLYRVPALRPTSSQRAQRFATRRSQISSMTIRNLVEGEDLEKTGPEWNRTPTPVAAPAEPSRWAPVSTATGAVLRACVKAINATLNFAYFVLMAILGLLMWAFIISLWLPVVALILLVIWTVASGIFGLIF
jgi:hypothetical protein